MTKIPKIIEKVGFDFSWSEKKVWELDVPVEEMNIEELEWHFDIPFWSTQGWYYDLKPIDVIKFPDVYKQEYDRTMEADLSYPIDIMINKGKWLILDGLHRLLKLKILGKNKVNVRKIPRDNIKDIRK